MKFLSIILHSMYLVIAVIGRLDFFTHIVGMDCGILVLRLSSVHSLEGLSMLLPPSPFTCPVLLCIRF